MESRKEARDRLGFHMSKQRMRFEGDHTATYLKVVDKQNSIISIARWHYYPEGYSYAQEIGWELHEPSRSKPMPENMNIDLHNFILSARDAERQHWQSQSAACWILMHMVTRQSQRGRGAAGMLIKWGLERAKDFGVPAYLEAGAQGRPIY